MNKKSISILCILLTLLIIFTGCTNLGTTPTKSPAVSVSPSGVVPVSPGASVTPGGAASPAESGSPSPAASPDVVTTASIVDNETAFVSAISDNGTWIICLTKDLTTSRDLVLEGEYMNGKKDDAGKDIIQRKIALYTQDADRNITARFTLTAPKLTIRSPQASIQHGTYKGDLYVESTDFKLVDTKVEGNIYFSSDAAKSGFSMDAESSVTGKQEVKE